MDRKSWKMIVVVLSLFHSCYGSDLLHLVHVGAVEQSFDEAVVAVVVAVVIVALHDIVTIVFISNKIIFEPF